jgi:hypothetical protein
MIGNLTVIVGCATLLLTLPFRSWVQLPPEQIVLHGEFMRVRFQFVRTTANFNRFEAYSIKTGKAKGVYIYIPESMSKNVKSFECYLGRCPTDLVTYDEPKPAARRPSRSRRKR